jgi:ubiquinone/menaquinone biosynthesis C-methylase UbiE
VNTASASAAVKVRTAGEPFDSIASAYDSVFTNSDIGRAQRAQVAAELNRRFVPGSCVLELSCGTGEDALALGRRGVEVRAFDASPAMIDAANRKLHANTLPANVEFGILRNEELSLIDGPFDGAFSNFAGMNCSSDWSSIAADLQRVVKPGGHVLLCIMGRACLWEIFYYLLRGQFRKAFRRKSRRSIARIGAECVEIQYVSVREAGRAFSSGFTLCGWRGVGVFVPPSYCEPLFIKRSKLLRVLTALDSRLAHVPGLRCWADHVLLDFVRFSR